MKREGFNLFDEYDKNLDRAGTADEINNEMISIYRSDIIYVWCKVFLFVVLGVAYIYLIKPFEAIKAAVSSKEVKPVAPVLAPAPTPPIAPVPPPVPTPVPTPK